MKMEIGVYKPTYGQPRKKGKFARKDKWVNRGLGIMVIGALVYIGGEYILAKVSAPELVYAATVATSTPVVEKLKGLSVEQLEDKLDAIVWGGESRNKTMKEGETFQTFDPPQSWINNGTVAAKCFKVGGKINAECFSFGPRQIKIPTLQNYWPKLHNGETISEKDARDCAESNECSRRFFLDCSITLKGCADNWTSFSKHKSEGQIYLDLIREAQGVQI